ncbi:MAG: hypothetical protein GXY44_05470 [Phycisphaerales bacterium]|nr:hypothetical protein [Phycisphaerales bacterium]
MKKRKWFGLLLMGLLLGGCDGLTGNGEEDPELAGVRFNIRIVAEAAEELADLENMASALEMRGLTATLLLAPELVQANCAQVQALQEAGFEIMAYASAQEIDGQSVTLSMLSEQEQTDYLQAIKEAFDECLAIPVEGFGCGGFDQNDFTWGILDAQGYTYNLGFLAHSCLNLPGHEGAFIPYLDDGYDFWSVPMCSAYVNKRWTPLSDASFINQVDATEWEALLKEQFDLMDTLGRPLMVEVYARHTGENEPWLDALMNIIAYARQKDAVFVSVEELITWVQSQADSLDCNCLQ